MLASPLAAPSGPVAPTPFADRAQVLRDVLEGLARPQKRLPGKYLWDETGSDLFDRICRTDDYYLTRRETALLEQAAAGIARTVGEGATLLEYGSGASRKVRVLLDAMAPRRYVAIDISAEYLDAAARRIAADYPRLAVLPVAADYTKALVLPDAIEDGPVLGFFPGSTIGNFDEAGVIAFLERVRATIGNGFFLVGHDPNRDEASLRRAYGEADGLMARLHLNMLAHINTQLGADFDLTAFRHTVEVRSDPPRVEAYLVATCAATYHVGDRTVSFAAGERLHTDSSYKMSPETFRSLAERAGWDPAQTWHDPQGLFALHLLKV